MPKKNAKLEEWIQEIKEDMDLDLDVTPSQIPRYFLRNVFDRVFAYLVGTDEDGRPVRLIASKSGALKVVYTGSGIEDISASDGTATTSLSAEIALPFTTNKIRIFANPYDLLVKFSDDGITYSDYIYFPAGIAETLDLVVSHVKVKAAGDVSTSYHIVSMR